MNPTDEEIVEKAPNLSEKVRKQDESKDDPTESMLRRSMEKVNKKRMLEKSEKLINSIPNRHSEHR